MLNEAKLFMSLKYNIKNAAGAGGKGDGRMTSWLISNILLYLTGFLNSINQEKTSK
jgi:hypothetical protein